MKSFTVIVFFALFAMVLASKYKSKFDNVNLDEVLGNRRLLVGYIKCVLELGHCTAEGTELKSHIKEGLEEDCEKCSDAQRKSIRRVVGHLINHEADYWSQLVAKYDPEHKYITKYEKELKMIKA